MDETILSRDPGLSRDPEAALPAADDGATRAERAVQAEADRLNHAAKRTAEAKGDEAEPLQTGERDYPTSFPPQHLRKPGLEAEIEPRPMYDAPAYRGSDKLLDRVALITGGDSGIGRSVAVLFAREGADVAIVYLPGEQIDADETRAAVEAEGRACLCIPGDVTDPVFCRDAVTMTIRQYGHLNVLVNNAAFQEHVERFEDLTEEHFDRTVKTNLYGYFHMAKAAVPYLNKGDSIINTGSVTGLMGNKDLLDYATTKGGIHAFTRSLATHLVDRGIRVNCVAPGPVWTPLNPADQDADEIVSFGSRTPMGRAAQPEEIAPAYVFLAAPSCSSYITGEVLPIIGGYSGG